MIDQIFSHFPGVGPKAEAKLRELGIHTWDTALARAEALPFSRKKTLTFLDALEKCQQALVNRDLLSLTQMLKTREHWRILAQNFSHAAFFDIETTGLSREDRVTVIACYYRGQVHLYIRDENLDEFLDFLEEIPLVVSFNGATFDVPHLLRTWHIPELPCAHIDVRWSCKHLGYAGGLKECERSMAIIRPAELFGINGADAIWLWDRWSRSRDERARSYLCRYAGADVIGLMLVCRHMLLNQGVSPEMLGSSEAPWHLLDQWLPE